MVQIQNERSAVNIQRAPSPPRLVTIAAFVTALTGALSAHPAELEPLLPEDLTINTATPSLHTAEVAFDGQRYLVVWSQDSGDSARGLDIYGRFVSASGSLEGDPFAITSQRNTQLAPDVAFNGTDYLVAWHDNFGTLPGNSINARVVSTGGDLLGSEVVVGSGGNTRFEPAVASDGADFLVVWYDARSHATNFFDVMGQRVSSQGGAGAALVGDNFLVSPAAESQFFPSVTFGKTDYLVTWSNDVVPNASQFDIRGTLVSPGGEVGAPLAISNAPSFQGGRPPGVSFDGENFLVAFDDHRDSLDPTAVVAARVSGEGSLLDGPPESGGIVVSTDIPGSPASPRVAFNGRVWLVVWGGGQIRGARITPDGELLDSPGVDLSRSDFVQFDPSVASGNGDFLVTWRRAFTSPASVHAQLVRVTNLNQPPDCSGATAEPARLWPPDHELVGIDLLGFSDPDGDPVMVQIAGVDQDEPVIGRGSGHTAPDAQIRDSELLLRAERSGKGDGRVYRVSVVAHDEQGGSCEAVVTVCVPHHRHGAECVDSGGTFDSLSP